MIVKSTKPLVVIEVCQIVESGAARWEAVISVPGREGTFRKVWGGVKGSVDVHALSDLSAWVALTVQNSVLTSYGAQGALWTDEGSHPSTEAP